jgi:hypothetical protein
MKASRQPPACCGRIAIGIVSRNRMRERGLGACAVIFEPWQWEWTSKPVVEQVPREPGTWARSLREAYKVLVDGEGNARWNHVVNASVIRPAWLSEGTDRTLIGRHTFIYIPPQRR